MSTYKQRDTGYVTEGKETNLNSDGMWLRLYMIFTIPVAVSEASIHQAILAVDGDRSQMASRPVIHDEHRSPYDDGLEMIFTSTMI